MFKDIADNVINNCIHEINKPYNIKRLENYVIYPFLKKCYKEFKNYFIFFFIIYFIHFMVTIKILILLLNNKI